MLPNEASLFLIRHLEGAARDEVKYQPVSLRTDPEAILSLLDSSFGGKLSAMQLRRMLFDREQGDKETVREYTKDLLELFDRLSRKDISVSPFRNNMLKEVFTENVKDKHLRCELKRMSFEHSEIQFEQMRQHAISWSEEDSRPRKSRASAHVAETEISESSSQLACLTRSIQELTVLKET